MKYNQQNLNKKQKMMNEIKQILNKKFKNEIKKNLLFKIIHFFIKDPDLYVGSGAGQKPSGSATLAVKLSVAALDIVITSDKRLLATGQ